MEGLISGGYKGEDIPEDLREFYDYVATGCVNSELTRKIDEAVVKGRKNEVWRTQYMKEWVIIQDAIEEERERAEKAEEEAAKERERAEKAEARIRELEAMIKAG